MSSFDRLSAGLQHKKKKKQLFLSLSTQRDSLVHGELFEVVVVVISSGREITTDITCRNALQRVTGITAQ